MSWQFVLTDRYGTPIGELRDGKSRTVALPLNRIPSGSFTVRTDNYLTNTVRQADQVLVKAYRNGTLTALGPLVPGYQKQVTKESRSIQVTWAGVGFRLSRRIIEASKSTSGVTYGDPNTPSSYMDRGAIATSIINGLNTAQSNTALSDTGIRIGSTPATSTTAVGPWYYKNALQALNELAATLMGFDWQLAPHEPTPDSIGLQLATFNCALAFGTTKPDVVFEYGDGKYNVQSFTEQTDFTGAMNQGYSVPQDFPTGTTPVVAYADTTAMTNSGTVYEDVISSDVITSDMQTKLLQQNVAVRKYPRMVITFIPTVDLAPGVLPQFGVDYGLGDVVRFRAVEFGKETINALFRVYEVDFTIDDDGNETATPILISTSETADPTLIS